ncbi:MAG: ImmA/IrrE family metallo-endopeptidase [Ruminococcus flavefaciens]|nr:ImmA/IrrE family metallo-endopeptidase [Ruminococcus flavefaciens]
MREESIITYAKMLRNNYPDKNAIEIAKILSYKVIVLDVDLKFMVAHMYRHKNGKKIIFLNSQLSQRAQQVACAHELGHIVCNHPFKNEYKDKNWEYEREANLFAVAFLFKEEDFNVAFKDMTNYILQMILDENMT